MKARKAMPILASVLLVGAACGFLGVTHVGANDAQRVEAAAQTRQVAKAATAFLNTLTAEQRQKAKFPFTPQKTAVKASFHRTADGGVAPGAPPAGPNGKGPGGPPHAERQHMGPPEGDRQGGPGGPGFGIGPPGGFVGEQYGSAVWSNYPVTDVLRPGLRLGSLTASQRSALMHLLQTMLSPLGYQKVQDIMGSDQALSETGQPFCSGTACYTIGIFGEPSDAKPWMIEFGGHHLGLNVVIAGSNGVMTPTLTGAQPSVYQRDGHTVRVLAQENDKAFALLNALDASQRKQAILNYQVDDLVLGPGHAGEQIQPEGLKASSMNDQQKALLLDVISEWAGIVQSAYASWNSDTLALKPQVLSILVGINDTFFPHEGGETLDAFERGYDRLLGTTIAALPGVRIILGEPFLLPVGKYAADYPAKLAIVRQHQNVVRRLAAKYHVLFVPYQSVFDRACDRAPAAHWSWDGVHPTYAGHWLMEEAWLQAVSAAPDQRASGAAVHQSR